MNKFRKGDIVGRISYNKDVIFEITNIIKTSNFKSFLKVTFILSKNKIYRDEISYKFPEITLQSFPNNVKLTS